jgi:hypothetical protein
MFQESRFIFFVDWGTTIDDWIDAYYLTEQGEITL